MIESYDVRCNQMLFVIVFFFSKMNCYNVAQFKSFIAFFTRISIQSVLKRILSGLLTQIERSIHE